MVMERASRQRHGEEAYELQRNAGIYGMIKYTAFASVACYLAHRQFPLFRRQTLALKGFLVSSATMAGLVIEAEDVLQRYERDQRVTHNLQRRWAKIGLSREGRVPTEAEIARWIQENKHRFPKLVRDADGTVRKVFPSDQTQPLDGVPAPTPTSTAVAAAAATAAAAAAGSEGTPAVVVPQNEPAPASSVWK